MSTFLGFLLFAALAVVVVYAIHRESKRRREALAALAAQLGASFEPGNDRDLPRSFRQFAFFERGKDRTAYNTLRGAMDVAEWRVEFTMGDYRYTVSQGDSETTHKVSYALVHLPFAAVPDLFVRREGLFDKLSGALGFDDIDFESDEFSSRYHVTSNDKRFAYAVIHPRMIEFLMDAEPPPIQLSAGSLLLTRDSEWDPDLFRAHLTWAREFFSRWPDHEVARLRA